MEKIQDLSIPVIAIDGGAGTGKGTSRAYVATLLGFHGLDSGVLYRALGLKAQSTNTSLSDTFQLVKLAHHLQVETIDDKVFLDGMDKTSSIRSEGVGKIASIIGQLQPIRDALLQFQLNMRKLPGLVADGRDMGDIFDTPYRFFIKTSVEERARRRVLQYENWNLIANYDVILAELKERDLKDETRAVSPLVPHKDAIIIDNTDFPHKFDTGKKIIQIYNEMTAKVA